MSRFGFGIISYFQLLKIFLFYFFVLTILYSPVLLNYMKYNRQVERPKKTFENMLMGNLGGATTRCITFRANVPDIVFGCEVGVIKEVVSVGVY